MVWKGFPAFPAHLRMRPVSRGNSRRATWAGPQAERPRFPGPLLPIVYSDSNYCVQTFNEWMFSWARNGWTKSDHNQPENLDLIQAYYDWYQKGYRIDLRKVKGHAGNKWNEIADQLATGKINPEEVYKIYG